MRKKPNQPRKHDVVFGGQNPPPIDAAILGGIEGVKLRLANPEVEVRVAALKEAINYGDAGIDLIIKALQDESGQVKFTAYDLLKDRTELKVKQHLANFLFFEFDVITVNEFGQEISRDCYVAEYFIEDLGNGVFLEMVLIPGGTFIMGSPQNEKGSSICEIPLHEVKVPPFFMGKYVVTQAHWEAVAALPQINSFLDPDPSSSKGSSLPVECVSWDEAIEFCARLYQKTGRNYCLPSEAQWEYACRAGTTTPFHFGKTITSELANFGYGIYASEPKGTYPFKTMPVGSYPPNPFGLYDMHGNVWEFCADDWHDNYEGAPSDGSAWQADNTPRKVVRGGGWSIHPGCCRSGFRYWSDRSNKHRGRSLEISFRVACPAERIN
ncbi:formylglycine-generating enzyme family protein [Planktothrix sp. FACHB-1355]|uniref:Formylglycine-generating enzyme family protein n=1 Tax=Aerosakkonema funiforme FACHB-1375 TaxID=2949571 RepID=A0A926VE03_9CYAN|nr:formylglycine-generating enzyme family protein [Aerosakkonema funiforme]MBD2180719.1 formylglycine-generating enzyme family protein [Aerosakkonema funiforme FACHB-1375]MBD3559209.1 formylglycine-generating enzyme family protein [Planktothrix sp. FACHB-1355]